MQRARYLALAALLCAALAHAHAVLTKAQPARRAVLSQSPSEVRLWFNEALEPSYARLSVRDAKGTAVTSAAASVDASDRKLLRLKLPKLAPGTYQVEFRVLSIDGHSVESNYKFTIK